MKYIYFLIAFLGFQFSKGQSNVLILGKVQSNNYSIAKVDVINLNQKKVAITNSAGEFSLDVRLGDQIIVFVKDYYDFKIRISQSEIDAKFFKINLLKKPIELEAVIISNEFNPSKIFSQAAADEINVYKNAARPKVIAVYDGSITNGMDFVRMGSDFKKVLKNIFGSKEKILQKEHFKFKDYVELNFDKQFFINTLKLQADQIVNFKEFCEADAKSNTLMIDVVYLNIYDFLILKNIEFKKYKK